MVSLGTNLGRLTKNIAYRAVVEKLWRKFQRTNWIILWPQSRPPDSFSSRLRDKFPRAFPRSVAPVRSIHARARTRTSECSFNPFARTTIILMPETQLGAHERSHHEMSIDEDPATHFPGLPVTQLDSDDFNALEQLLDGLYVARDGTSVRSALQRVDVATLSTSAVTVTLLLDRDLEWWAVYKFHEFISNHTKSDAMVQDSWARRSYGQSYENRLLVDSSRILVVYA